MAAKNESIYTDLDLIPIYNFDKCIKDDLKFMYLSKQGEITHTVIDKWNELYNRYCELTAGNETANYYRLIGEIEWLEKRIIILPTLLNMLLKADAKNRLPILKEISAWRLPINGNKDVEIEVKRVVKALNNSKTRLQRKINDYKIIQQSNEKSSGTVSLQSQAIMIHKHLGVKPNIYEDSAIMWLEYFNEMDKLNKRKDG